MFNLFNRFLSGDHKHKNNTLSLDERVVPSELRLQETDQHFPFSNHVKVSHNFPRVDWGVIRAWVESLENEKLRGDAWSSSVDAWLLHLQAALGCLGTNLGDYVCFLLEKPTSIEFEPIVETFEKQQASAALAKSPLNSD